MDCGTNWTLNQLEATINYDAHPSDTLPKYLQLIEEETPDKLSKWFARIVRWGDLNLNILSKIKFSRFSITPHKSRLFQCILDMSLNTINAGEKFNSVNDSTEKLSEKSSMNQLRQALKLIVAVLSDKQRSVSPCLFSKLNTKHGFRRMIVSDKMYGTYVTPCHPKYRRHTQITFALLPQTA